MLLNIHVVKQRGCVLSESPCHQKRVHKTRYLSCTVAQVLPGLDLVSEPAFLADVAVGEIGAQF
jgi:hypothetical protein